MSTCMTCKWCDIPSQLIGQQQGMCHLNPPQTSLIGTPNGPQPITVQNIVKIDHDYCSHYVVQLVKPANGPTLVK